MPIVENIKSLCAKAGTSIPKLESELGFGRGSIYNWDKSSPSIDKVQKVANHFNVSLDYIIYGFELTEFVQLVNFVRDNRTYEQFSEDTGIDFEDIFDICMGLKLEPVSVETIKKISSSNPVDYIVSEEDLLKAAGHFKETPPEELQIPSWATYKDKIDFKHMLQADAPVMFDGVPLDEEDKEKVLKVMEAIFWDAKKRNKRKPIDD